MAWTRLISKTTIATGHRTLVCRGPHNPVGFWTPGGLDWINLADEKIKRSTSLQADCKIKAKNVVSVGRRQDASPVKFLGLRPDTCQDGSEQLEWTFEAAEFDGRITPYDPRNFHVWNHRQRCRHLLVPPYGCKSFRIVYRLNLTGMRIEERYGEFWMYSISTGEFRFRIRKPAICDPVTQQPVLDADGEQLDLVRHSLVRDGDSFLYVKTSSPDFTKAKLDKGWLLDGDIYYGSTADGRVQSVAGSWASARDAATGTGVSAGDTRYK